MRTHLKLFIAALLLLVSAVRADEAPTSQPENRQVVNLRERFNLPRLVLMRQAVQEYDFGDDELKDRVLQVMDDTRDAILDAIEHEKISPSDPQELAVIITRV